MKKPHTRELTHSKATTRYAIFAILGVLVIVVGANLLFKAPIQPMFMVLWLYIYPVCMALGWSFKEIDAAVLDGCRKGLSSVLLLFAVGALIAGWIAAGTVPAIIYFGLQIIEPHIFLVATFVLCSVMSIACGTSWGTMGTAGIAMFAIGEGLGIPAGVTVGAIVSGSFLGDMISPMSDSTNVASAACETDLFTHCKELVRLVSPVFLITAGIFYVMGIKYATDSFDNSYILEIQASIASHFEIGLPVFIPIILLLFRLPAFHSMVTPALVALVVAATYQGMDPSAGMGYFWTGYKLSSGEAFLDTLLNRGGVGSMFSTGLMMLFAFGMVGAFTKVGILEAIVNPISKKVRSLVELTAISQIIAIIGNTMGTNCFSILMTGSLMLPAYRKYDLHPTNLSKLLNCTSTVVCALVPVNAAAIYTCGLFNVSVIDYLPYSVYAYLLPVFALLMVILNVRVVPAEVDLENGQKFRKKDWKDWKPTVAPAEESIPVAESEATQITE